jgi:hypothetical protein
MPTFLVLAQAMYCKPLMGIGMSFDGFTCWNSNLIPPVFTLEPLSHRRKETEPML